MSDYNRGDPNYWYACYETQLRIAAGLRSRIRELEIRVADDYTALADAVTKDLVEEIDTLKGLVDSIKGQTIVASKFPEQAHATIRSILAAINQYWGGQEAGERPLPGGKT